MTAAHPALAACGFLDFTCQVSQAVTGWFACLVQSAVNPVLGLIGNGLLSTPQPGSFGAVTGMWADLAGHRRRRLRAAGPGRRDPGDGI